MDKISFKAQSNRASQALVVTTSEYTKRALLKTLYNETMMSGRELVMTGVDLDDSTDQNVKGMTFGIRGNYAKTGITGDTQLYDAITAGVMLMCVVIENTTQHTAQVSMGINPSGFEVFQEQPIPPGITTITVNRVYDLLNPVSAYLHHAGNGDSFNGAVLNITCLFKPL